MPAPSPVSISKNAPAELVRYCKEQGLSRLILVADRNTFGALGERVEQDLSSAGLDVQRLVLPDGEVIADAEHIFQVLVECDPSRQAFLAVGAGTIADIVRFVSHRMSKPFISIPTAPSVDGYTSVSAPLVIDRYKRTVNAQGPLALFADLPTLCAAPQAMIAAGFGDILGKYTSLADWQLGHIVWGERYDPEIASQTRAALLQTADMAAGIRATEETAVRHLMEALIESGMAMLRFGDSRPASGSEHHLSHFWEMRHLLQGRPPLLHGAKVGVACVLMAGLYREIRGLSAKDVKELLAARPAPDYEAEVAAIRTAYGPTADQVIASHQEFLQNSAGRYAAVAGRIVSEWEAIQQVASQVPTPQEIVALLKAAGAPAYPEVLGIIADEVREALAFAHYLRPRFTVLKLAQMLWASWPALAADSEAPAQT